MNNKKLVYILGGFGALVAGALIYNYLNKSEKKYESLTRELQALGQARKNPDGSLKREDFVKIFTIISKHSKLQMNDSKSSFMKERRALHQQKNEEAYKKAVIDRLHQEEEIYTEVANLVLGQMGVSEEEFMISQQVHMADPMFQKHMMEMHLAIDDQATVPEWLTKEKTKEIFKFVEESKREAVQALGKKGPGSSNMMDATFEIVVQQAKTADLIFEKFGIEEEQFMKAIQTHRIMEDPEIRRLMGFGAGGNPFEMMNNQNVGGSFM